MAKLILVRHGESEWNNKGVWTGLTDIGLTEKGFAEGRRCGEVIRGIPIDVAYVSVLKRAQQTLDAVCDALGITPTRVVNAALNERDYGIYTAKNKWEVKQQIGEKAFLELRRGWDNVVPGGENLKDVYNRVVPYYQETILPKLTEGKNALVSAHGNSLRALIKYLENISDEDIPDVEFGTGAVHIYDLDSAGNILNKTVHNFGKAP